MPFVSEKQRRYCYVLQKKSLIKGEKPLWDCKKFGLDKKSPMKSPIKSQRKSKVKSQRKSKVKSPRKSKVKSPRKSKVKSPRKSNVESPRKSNVESPRKSNVESQLKNNCIISTKNKYLNRPSPPYPAQNCKNKYKLGNDSFIYQSLPDKNNIYKWKKI